MNPRNNAGELNLSADYKFKLTVRNWWENSQTVPFGVQLSGNVPVTGTSTKKSLLTINSISKLIHFCNHFTLIDNKLLMIHAVHALRVITSLRFWYIFTTAADLICKLHRIRTLFLTHNCIAADSTSKLHLFKRENVATRTMYLCALTAHGAHHFDLHCCCNCRTSYAKLFHGFCTPSAMKVFNNELASSLGKHILTNKYNSFMARGTHVFKIAISAKLKNILCWLCSQYHQSWFQSRW